MNRPISYGTLGLLQVVLFFVLSAATAREAMALGMGALCAAVFSFAAYGAQRLGWMKAARASFLLGLVCGAGVAVVGIMRSPYMTRNKAPVTQGAGGPW